MDKIPGRRAMGASSFLGPSTWHGRPCLLRNAKRFCEARSISNVQWVVQCVSGLDVSKGDNGSRPIMLFVLSLYRCLSFLSLRHAKWNASPVPQCYKQQWALLRVPAVGSAVWTSSGGPRLGRGLLMFIDLLIDIYLFCLFCLWHRHMWHHM